MKKNIDSLFHKNFKVCPWWLCWTFDNPIRKLIHNPQKIVAPYIQPGSTVIDIGPGMGYFSIPMAKLVGKKGKVIAIDIQEKMLNRLRNRVAKYAIGNQIITHLGEPKHLPIQNQADFILAFWMVHEVPNQHLFLKQLFDLLKSDGLFLIVEPKFHVSKRQFDLTIQIAKDIGFLVQSSPSIAFSRTALLGISSSKMH